MAGRKGGDPVFHEQQPHGAMPVSGQALSVYAAKTGRRESNACTSGHRRRKAGGRKPDKNESKA